MLDSYIKHSRNRTYMSGIQRDKSRVKQTAEIFTPTELVVEKIDKLSLSKKRQLTIPLIRELI